MIGRLHRVECKTSKEFEQLKPGDKIEAKIIAKNNGLPVIEGSEGGIKDVSEIMKICNKLSVSGNLIDRPEISLVHNDALNAQYYELVRDALDNHDYNVDAMFQCIQTQLNVMVDEL